MIHDLRWRLAVWIWRLFIRVAPRDCLRDTIIHGVRGNVRILLNEVKTTEFKLAGMGKNTLHENQ